MPQRVPIKIFRLKKSSSASAVQMSSSRFVQNRTTADIYTKVDGFNYIKLYLGDIPGLEASYIGEKKVNYNSTYNLYTVDANGTTFFINEYGGIKELGLTLQPQQDAGIAPLVFEFYVNPEHVKPTYRKLITEIRTRGGWEIQHWGDALTEISVSGRSGGMHKIVERTSEPYFRSTDNIMDSTAWKRLSQLRSLYTSDHSVKNKEADILLGFSYFDKFYVGYFTDFQGPEADKDSPYIVNYSFNFKVQSETTTQQLGV